MPKRTPHLVTKGARFYFRVRVPVDLVSHVGKSEITHALGDVSRDQAEVAVSELAGQWSAHFLAERHRLGLTANPPAPPMRAALPKREATIEEVQALAQVAARELLAQDEEVRIDGMSSDGADAWLGTVGDLDRDVSRALSDGLMGSVKPRVLAQLAARGLTLPEDRTEARRALRAWSGVQARAVQAIADRSRGEPIETPPPVALPASLEVDPVDVDKLPADKKPPEALKLRDVFELWKTDERKRPAKTVQKALSCVGHFERLTGNPSLGLITKGMGSEFRRAKAAATRAANKAAKEAANAAMAQPVALPAPTGGEGLGSAAPWE